MPARILVDLLSFTGTRGGTETYAREISTRLPAAMPGVQFAALANRAGAERVRAFFPGPVRVLPWVGGDRVTWAAGELVGASGAARRARADLMWSPANFAPVSGRVPRVVTVHDVTYHEASGGPAARAVAGATAWLMSRAALGADAVITGSHAAERDIVAHIGVPAASVTVIPHGTAEPRPPADVWATLAPLGITPGRPLLLSTGNRLPHKNFDGLLRAAATIEPARRPRTVITGGRGADPLQPLVDELGLSDDVVLPGWTTLEQLEALYAVADLYVCPSLAEGFGLPVIDAMRRGCDVLANDIPVLREVGGDAALYADASSPSALGGAIEDVLATAPDAVRRAAGLAWSASFTWEAAAKRTAAVFAAVLAGSPGVRRG